MSELIGEVKVFLMKAFEDVQFKIDIACQTIITKRQSEGLAYLDYENRYIHGFIADLKAIEDKSMDKLNKFIEKEEVNKLEQFTKDEILFQAGCETVVYVEFDDLHECFKQHDVFVIGSFVHSPFWLNPNQANYIRVKRQDPDKSKNINIILDQVSLLKS